jgi:hypothetical protein
MHHFYPAAIITLTYTTTSLQVLRASVIAPSNTNHSLLATPE